MGSMNSSTVGKNTGASLISACTRFVSIFDILIACC